MLRTLSFVVLAVGIAQGQSPANAPPLGSPVLQRIGGVDAPTPSNSVAGSLVPVPAGTTYYTQNSAYDFIGEGPPEDWCKTSNDTKCACQTGRQQSPLDLSSETLRNNGITAEVLASPYSAALAPNYSTAAIVNVSNPGHGTPQINIAPDSPENTLRFNNDRTFMLVQIHFHAAAEHTFNGTRADFEAHFVHKDPTTNGLAVFGFLFQKRGETPDPLLSFTLQNRPTNSYTGPDGQKAWNTSVVSSPVDLQSLLSPYYQGHFLYYQGSLTTPPCTEGVQWFLFPRLLDMTDDQLDAFEEYAGVGSDLCYKYMSQFRMYASCREIYADSADEQYAGTNKTAPENYRPTQPLNGRTVELY